MTVLRPVLLVSTHAFRVSRPADACERNRAERRHRAVLRSRARHRAEMPDDPCPPPAALRLSA